MKKLFVLLALMSCFTLGCKKADTTTTTTDTTPAASDTDADASTDDTSTEETN